MAKIKVPAIKESTFTIPDIGVAQKGVQPARVRRPVPGGEGIQAQILGDLSDAAGDFVKMFAAKEKKMLNVKSDDLLATLDSQLKEKYASEIAPLRSGSATDALKNEIAFVTENKEKFLKLAEGDKKLQDRLSIGYNALTRKYLGDVMNHKLVQDDVYRKDTAKKVATNLQTEMTSLGIGEGKRMLDLSNKIDNQLVDYPIARELAKLQAWQGHYKFNARMNPDRTQAVYENEATQKAIVGEIGAEGYSSIQEHIDKGRQIKIQDEALAKQQAEEAKDERNEGLMTDAMHVFFADEKTFTPDYIDHLGTKKNLPSTDQRILNGLLDSIIKKGKLTDLEVDWPTFAELLEDVRLGKLTKEKTVDVQRKVIAAMNRTITIDQGKSMLKALSNRDVFDNPVVADAFDEIKVMYREGKIKTPEKYGQLIRGLFDTAVDTDGDSKKMQEYMQDIVDPSVRKGGTQRFLEEKLPWLIRKQPEMEAQPPVTLYMTDTEERDLNNLLATQPTKDGVVLTMQDLPDKTLQVYLDYIRSPEYVAAENKRNK